MVVRVMCSPMHDCVYMVQERHCNVHERHVKVINHACSIDCIQ